MQTQGNPAETLGSESDKGAYPSISLAYEFVRPSYDWALQRLAAVDSHIQTLQAFAASITVAFPIISAAVIDKPDFKSPLFILALAVFAVIIVSGLVVRALGAVDLVNPHRLWEEWLYLAEDEFKKDMIFFAGNHMESNANLINWKGWTANVMVLLFLLEIGLMLAWIIAQV